MLISEIDCDMVIMFVWVVFCYIQEKEEDKTSHISRAFPILN